MPRILAALAAGLLFGAGLAVSDMVNPARVLAFLKRHLAGSHASTGTAPAARAAAGSMA